MFVTKKELRSIYLRLESLESKIWHSQNTIKNKRGRPLGFSPKKKGRGRPVGSKTKNKNDNSTNEGVFSSLK